MKVHAFLPVELFKDDLSEMWDHLSHKLHENFPSAEISSNYTGDGDIESSDVIIFIYEFKEYESVRNAIEVCRRNNTMYNFFTKFYAPDRFTSEE